MNFPTWYCYATALLLTIFMACDKKDDKNDGNGNESSESSLAYGKVKLVSDSLASVNLVQEDIAYSDCSAITNNSGGPVAGKCTTPLAVTGYAARVSLTSDTLSQIGPARILANDATVAENGAIFTGGEFDFADPSKGLVGNNTLWQDYTERRSFNYVSTEMPYLRVKFKAADKFVTMLIVAFGQPFEDSEEAAKCWPADMRTQSRFTDANLLPGMTFKRGDYLFCVKDTSDAACAAADYQWFDTATNQLAATRPNNPRQTSSITKGVMECSGDGERASLNWDLASVTAAIPDADAFKLYADFSHGTMSNQWKDASQPLGAEAPENAEEGTGTDPYLIYYYAPANGAEQTGSNLDIEFTFDVTNAVYVEGADNADDLNSILGNVYFKPMWLVDQWREEGIEGGDADADYGVSAKAEVTLTGGTDAPAPLE